MTVAEVQAEAWADLREAIRGERTPYQETYEAPCPNCNRPDAPWRGDCLDYDIGQPISVAVCLCPCEKP